MYEGRLRARPRNPESSDRPLSAITNRKRERADRYPRRADMPRTGRGDAAAATWILRGAATWNVETGVRPRYQKDAAVDASPEIVSKILRRAAADDRRWLEAGLRRADAEAGGLDGGRVVRAEPSWSRRRNARVAALCAKLGLRAVTARSGDGAAGVSNIPYRRRRGTDFRGGSGRRRGRDVDIL